MSKYFAFIEGKPYDYKFRKSHRGAYIFSLGSYDIAILDRLFNAWTVTVLGERDLDNPHSVYLVRGFASRHKAIDYALKVHMKTRDMYNK